MVCNISHSNFACLNLHPSRKHPFVFTRTLEDQCDSFSHLGMTSHVFCDQSHQPYSGVKSCLSTTFKISKNKQSVLRSAYWLSFWANVQSLQWFLELSADEALSLSFWFPVFFSLMCPLTPAISTSVKSPFT